MGRSRHLAIDDEGVVADRLCGRLARGRGTAVLTGVLVAHRQATDARREESEGVVLGLRVEVVAGTSGCRAVACRLERRLSRTAVEGASRVSSRRGSKVSIQRRIRRGTAAETRRESVGARRTTEVLAISGAGTEATSGRAERTRPGVTAHGTLAHGIRGRRVHGRGIAGISNHSSTSTAGTAAEAANVLCKVVVAADLIAALPVASTERNNARATHAAVATMGMMGHVGRGRQHGRRGVAIAITHLARGASGNSRERATEAGSTSLEVGKAAGRACPVTRARPVLARREGSENLGRPVQDSAR